MVALAAWKEESSCERDYGGVSGSEWDWKVAIKAGRELAILIELGKWGYIQMKFGVDGASNIVLQYFTDDKVLSIAR